MSDLSTVIIFISGMFAMWAALQTAIWHTDHEFSHRVGATVFSTVWIITSSIAVLSWAAA